MDNIISIVGAGGKTTLMFKTAEELRKNNKVLVTTTTKIYLPDRSQYDYIGLNIDEIAKLNKQKENGIYVYGESVTSENKVIGLSPDFLESITKYFDYVIIESDGAKRKLIKGWNETEPVIINNTTFTFGVLNVKSLGMEINDENVHRVHEFIKITKASMNEKTNINHLVSMVYNINGLFKNSKGRKILYIIGDNEELIASIKKFNYNYIDEIRCIK
ncbi:MAG: selenium cofactor biosynthesis protein YqeC [Solirubrobacterales bacterium]